MKEELKILDRTEPHPSRCELCSRQVDDLRPYGPKGENICFKCAMKDEETTKRRFREVTGIQPGDEVVVINVDTLEKN